MTNRKDLIDMISAQNRATLTVNASGQHVCIDCGKINPFIYMVKDLIWLIHTDQSERDKHICLDCFEIRLDRKLCIKDLNEEVPVNEPILAGFNIGIRYAMLGAQKK